VAELISFSDGKSEFIQTGFALGARAAGLQQTCGLVDTVHKQVSYQFS
jgi:hypothetical protein